VDNSFRYIFIYRFSYLLTYYYSFLAHYNKKCFDINWFHLLSLCWYSRFEVTWLLRDDSNSKTRVRFVYVLPHILHGDFVYEIKYLVKPQLNILHILTRNVIFFYDYSNWGELSFNIFQVFHVYKPNTCFAVRVISQKSCDLKARIPTKTRWRD
jgi:hypothetical protein